MRKCCQRHPRFYFTVARLLHADADMCYGCRKNSRITRNEACSVRYRRKNKFKKNRNKQIASILGKGKITRATQTADKQNKFKPSWNVFEELECQENSNKISQSNRHQCRNTDWQISVVRHGIGYSKYPELALAWASPFLSFTFCHAQLPNRYSYDSNEYISTSGTTGTYLLCHGSYDVKSVGTCALTAWRQLFFFCLIWRLGASNCPSEFGVTASNLRRGAWH